MMRKFTSSLWAIAHETYNPFGLAAVKQGFENYIGGIGIKTGKKRAGPGECGL